ncbi:MAG: DUF4417 domain-containing protein [Coriobacteriales bacterium]|nr:DUF4417 domain-containing protein [Coriobacteriales bacterium]
MADDLTELQSKAYRLADNKTAELANWDFSLLNFELDAILESHTLNMEDFGFEFDIDTTDSKNERLRTDNSYNLRHISKDDCSGEWEMPTIECQGHTPKDLIPFNCAKTSNEYSSGIHFFIDDYQFERVWNDLPGYVDILKKFDCVMSPDFSLYLDMPLPMKIWNVYRSRAVGHFWQKSGLTVIPTLSWAGPETFVFCFEGIPQGSIVAVSTIGIKNSARTKAIWHDGMAEAIRQLEPETVLVYGSSTGFDFGNTKTIEYPTFTEVRHGR